jgi:hypothetical protein
MVRQKDKSDFEIISIYRLVGRKKLKKLILKNEINRAWSSSKSAKLNLS